MKYFLKINEKKFGSVKYFLYIYFWSGGEKSFEKYGRKFGYVRKNVE